MIKRVIQTLTVLAVLTVTMMGNMTVFEGADTIAAYEGKWKVTKMLEERYRSRTNFFPHHFLGRTMILGETSVERSFWEWPHLIDWTTSVYDLSEVVWLPKNDKWVWVNYSWEIDKVVEGEQVQFIRYLDIGLKGEEYVTNDFIVLDGTHLIYDAAGAFFLLEPFRYCDPEVSMNSLPGTWEIAYLDSYEEGYAGSYEEIKELKEHMYKGENWDALKGTDFAAEEWLGKTVHISENTLTLAGQPFEIEKVEESRVLRELFEEEMEIHDGLSIYDDEINVCSITCGSCEDIICVLVDQDNAIMHIEQGWFMLIRKDNG